jgi:hypothetical protein
MLNAAAHNELTEAICLLPPVRRAFDSSLREFRERLAALPEPRIEIPAALEYPPFDELRRVPMYLVGWFSGALALALIACFTLGFITGQRFPGQG